MGVLEKRGQTADRVFLFDERQRDGTFNSRRAFALWLMASDATNLMKQLFTANNSAGQRVYQDVVADQKVSDRFGSLLAFCL